MTPTWQQFFDSHAPEYDQNGFAQHTEAEVDFFLSLFPLTPGSLILDMGCGTGRHCVELAKRGYRMTGVDLSSGMLEIARSKAKEAGVYVEWIHADGKTWMSDRVYDAAICLCEGGIGLIEKGENAEAHDLAMLGTIARTLKANAPFLLTAMNGYAIIRQMSDQQISEGRFNPATMYATYQDEWNLPGGPKLMDIYERLFIAPEVVQLLMLSGFTVDNIYGGTAGHWGRRFLSLDEVEAMFVCRKRG